MNPIPALSKFDTAAVTRLVLWYQKNHRAFPWRQDPSPYKVWLAEVMSQQTQIATLLPYFERFTTAFPDVVALARATEQEVFQQWTGLGYYSRARNVLRAAQKISEQGRFPQTYAEWLEIPGVGPYTAAAISSQCYGESVPAFDGNVSRVCSRLDARADVWTKGSTFQAEVVTALQASMQDFSASHFNQAIMELGALVCSPKTPRCGVCPISNSCRAYQEGRVAEFPPPKPRKNVLTVQPKVFVVRRRTQRGIEALLVRRPEGTWFGGMWDFCTELGGVAEPTKPILATLLKQPRPLGKVKHSITHHKIELQCFVDEAYRENVPEKLPARKKKGDPAPVSADPNQKYILIADLAMDQPPVPLATTARKVLKLLLKQEPLC